MKTTITAIEEIRSFERFGSVLGLERMRELMQRLGNPQEGLKYIHVAGTNGKGSVCRYLYEILRESGYGTGLFTSPFVQDFHERIEFDGQVIPDNELETCTSQVVVKARQMEREGLGSPTEFEVVTAIAFVYFQKMKADMIVLEVGLGGTGDSTNVIKSPLVSVITSISYDHMDWLGHTLGQIAAEKAGIIKAGIPVVVNGCGEEAAAVIERVAKEKNAMLYNAAEMGYTVTEKVLSGYRFDSTVCGVFYGGLKISMLGEHQVQNAVTALTAIEILRQKGDVCVSKGEISSGLIKAAQMGRFEIVKEHPYLILDGAHNGQGAQVLLNTIKEHFADKRILMVVGMLADKDIDGILNAFGQIAQDFIATEPGNARKLPADKLCGLLQRAGKQCRIAARPDEAFRLAMTQKKEFDVLLFAGSLYLIGEIRRIVYEV